MYLFPLYLGTTGQIWLLLTHEHLLVIVQHFSCLCWIFNNLGQTAPSPFSDFAQHLASCFLYYLDCSPLNKLHNLHIFFREGFPTSTLASPIHRKVPGTHYRREGEEGGKQEENRTPDSKHSLIWWSSFSLPSTQSETIFNSAEAILITYRNVTVNKTHLALPSHLFTVCTGTSGYLHSSSMGRVLESESGPHRGCSPSPGFHVILTRTPYRCWPKHKTVW